MSNRNHSNVLLVEILIALFFFMISATVVVQVFGTSRGLSERAAIENLAISEAQNVAEALYAAESPDTALQHLGFRLSHSVWTRSFGNYTLCVETGSHQEEAGELWQATVRAFISPRRSEGVQKDAEELFALPCVRYKGGAL